jgi:hypothetical protein
VHDDIGDASMDLSELPCGGGVAVLSPCGERRLEPRDLTLRGLLERIFHAVTNLDGRTLRTSWDLLRRPGVLTAAYLGGKRKPYLAPFQVFLLANVLFFAVQSVSNSSVFGIRISYRTGKPRRATWWTSDWNNGT